MISSSLSRLYDSRAGESLDRQLLLVDRVASLSWRFDLESGRLSFGDRYRWQVQVLGSESYGDNTWLWAWANEASPIPVALLRAAVQMKELGLREHIPELTTPRLPLGDVNGHMLAMIASGVCQSAAYYRAPYKGGAAFLLITDPAFERRVEQPLARIPFVFSQAISQLPIRDHRLAFESYVRFYGLQSEREGDVVVAYQAGRPVLTAHFDEQGRLVKLEATPGNRL